MTDLKLLFTLPLLLIFVAATKAELHCYECVDCEAKEKYENTAKSCKPYTPTNSEIPSRSLVLGDPPASSTSTSTTAASSTTSSTTAPPSTSSSTTTLPSTSSSTTPTSNTSSTTTPTSNPSSTTTPANRTSSTTTTTSFTVSTEASTEPSSTATSSTTHKPITEPPKPAAPKIPKCVLVEYTVGGKKKINRGCSLQEKSVKNETICNSIVNNDKANRTLCNVCETDKCNSATNIAVGLLPLIMGLLLIK